VEEGANLADAFYRQGARAVIGWGFLVTLEFSDHATLQLIKALAVERLTARQSTEKVNLENGADPVYKSRLKFYPEQNGEKTLLIEPGWTEMQKAEIASVVLLNGPKGHIHSLH